MSSTKSNSVPSPESVHDVWLRQRSELEHDLFDGWPTMTVTPAPPFVQTTNETGKRPANQADLTGGQLSGTEPIAGVSPALSPAASAVPLKSPSVEPPAAPLDRDRIQQAELLKQANDLALRQRIDHQHLVAENLTQQREAFLQDLARLRAAFEQEMSARESAWTTQRDQEWTALQSAKEVQELTKRRLQDELATQRVHEREELLQWRKQVEAELAEARRLFEQERLQQQQEFARQRQTEMSRLRHEREDFEARVRQTQSELATARQRQEDDLRHSLDAQAAQMRAERAELDKLRDTWLEKFRREQVVLENGLQFFGQHLSRVSEDLRVAQRGLQAVAESATEVHPVMPFAIPATATQIPETPPPPVLSLQEIHERLTHLRQTQRNAA